MPDSFPPDLTTERADPSDFDLLNKPNGDSIESYDSNFLSRFANLLLGSPSNESLQKLISDPKAIAIARKTAKMLDLGEQNGCLGRELLSAFLVSKFPQNLFGSHPSKEEEQVVNHAKNFLEIFRKFTLEMGYKQAAKSAFLEYQSMFNIWREADKPLLVNSLIDRYIDFELARTSEEFDQEDRACWEKNIDEMQQQIRDRLSRIGGEEAMEKLDEATKIAKTRFNPAKAITLEVPIINVVPIAAIIHELCFNRHFDLIQIIQQYASIPQPQLIKVGTEEAVGQLMDYLRENLLPIIPKGTRQELSAHLEPEYVRQQVKEKKFSLEGAARIAIDVMANSCAPMRDSDIANLKKMLDEQESIESVLTQMVHLVELMRLDFVAYELIQSRPFVLESLIPYEKKYFSGMEYTKSKEFAQKYPDWSEWLFMEKVEEMESMVFDKDRLSGWRKVLKETIFGAAAQIISRHSVNSNVQLDLSSGLPLVLKQRLQAAIKEAVMSGAVRKKEHIERDGFTSPNVHYSCTI